MRTPAAFCLVNRTGEPARKPHITPKHLISQCLTRYGIDGTPLALTLNWMLQMLEINPQISWAAKHDVDFLFALGKVLSTIGWGTVEESAVDYAIECFALVQATAFLRGRRTAEVGHA